MEKELAVLIAKLQGIAQTGKTYAKDPYDLERYDELKQITGQLAKLLYPTIPDDRLTVYLSADDGYATPKVDIRAVIFDQQDRLLLVQEKSDARWALPGGWADIGYSPMEIAEKETFEEAGIQVTGDRLIAVRDKAKHDYPPALIYTYKLFISCLFVEGELTSGLETSDVRFFSKTDVQKLALSEERNTYADIEMLFEDHFSPHKERINCD
ncbi:NUDIX hydrolase N-terminal domain-containing protein [uncultured Enterococcus sp.]|uniref:NUDIX hydrolase N-terminal domain-containing protein n=1 Tax=uncultured Enterococcus sp. TaxID=167972 RepID=UPI002AA942E7|nr:NUDIX hydrolase N-terminal domain-containing protein [uncultured Enterococcus sp.]